MKKSPLPGWLLAAGLLVSIASAADPRRGTVRVAEEGRFLVLDSGAVCLRLESAPAGGLLLNSFRLDNGGREWASPGTPLSPALVCDATGGRLASDQDFRYRGHTQRPIGGGGTELTLTFSHEPTRLVARLSIAAYPNSPVLDWCLQVENPGDSPVRNLSRYDPVSLGLGRKTQAYFAHWVTRDHYNLHEAAVKAALSVDGGNWNGPNAAGWLALEDRAHGAYLVAGIEWERQWAFDLSGENQGRTLRFAAGLRRGATLDLAPGAVLESPHVFVGLASGDLEDAANVSRDFLEDHLLAPPLPDSPFVSYDIWSTEGSRVEERIVQEADFAAKKLGVEVFYHDAAWYRDSDVSNHGKWGVGLGSYQEDARKFPHGLRHLSDVVHGLGMKFGLWVCPEMVDVTVMRREGIPDAWMTQAEGKFNVELVRDWNPMKMLCLGDPEVERYLESNLVRLVSEDRLDWIKWDASGLPGRDIVCDRTDHGHQAGNGSQAAVVGKYRVVQRLHERFPNLTIEQCSYGTRLDYGMSRYGSRVNWLNDTTGPSSRVRDLVWAGAYVFPSACNNAWIKPDDEVMQARTPALLDTIFRSRMMGAFGFGTFNGNLDERVSLYPPAIIAAAVRNVRNYKAYRQLLRGHVFHLTPWGRKNQWQGLQFAARDGGEALVFLFRNGSSEARCQFRLRGLDSEKTYQGVSLNTGIRSAASGADLMQSGMQATLDQEPQESEIVWLK